MSRVMPFHQIAGLVGHELGPSDWIPVDQGRIALFAEATDDFNAVHLDPSAAREAGLDQTIAHGLLTMGLLTRLGRGLLPVPAEMTGGFYYGFDKVRLITPVFSGARVRGRFQMLAYQEMKPGRWLRRVAATVEVEGQDRPALTCAISAVHMVPPEVAAASAGA